MLNDFLQDLIINLDLRLNEITDNSSIYDYCEDALDLIARDKKATAIYKRICELTDYQTEDIEDLNEILQSYDIEIKRYHEELEQSK